MITAIVVRQGLELPGDEWLPGGTDNLTARQNRTRFDAECERVFACKGWDRLLIELGLAPSAR